MTSSIADTRKNRYTQGSKPEGNAKALKPRFPYSESGNIARREIANALYLNDYRKRMIHTVILFLSPLSKLAFSSTKSAFMCFVWLRTPRFWPIRAQNRGFCALLGSRTPIFRLFEHKIGVFVLEQRGKWDRKA